MKDEGDYKWHHAPINNRLCPDRGQNQGMVLSSGFWGLFWKSKTGGKKNYRNDLDEKVVIIGLLIQQRSVITSHAINLENQKVIVGHPVMVKRVRSAEVSYIFIHAWQKLCFYQHKNIQMFPTSVTWRWDYVHIIGVAHYYENLPFSEATPSVNI